MCSRFTANFAIVLIQFVNATLQILGGITDWPDEVLRSNSSK